MQENASQQRPQEMGARKKSQGWPIALFLCGHIAQDCTSFDMGPAVHVLCVDPGHYAPELLVGLGSLAVAVEPRLNVGAKRWRIARLHKRPKSSQPKSLYMKPG